MGRLEELAAKVDAFFARVADRHGADMQCATGCSDCCHVRLTITEVEAEAIRALAASWPAHRRRALALTPSTDTPTAVPAERPRAEACLPDHPDRSAAEAGPGDPHAAAPGAERCAALDRDGRCKIYDARPLVCRSHGVPIRLRQGGLPVVQACHRNFTQTTPDPDCVLDQTTLSATLYAVAAAAAAAAGRAPQPQARRVELARLLADLAVI